MSIKIIAAIGKNRELGAKNALLWNLPGDMKFFRETTRGFTVIMGRLTYESIGRPLPKRRNIVITRSPDFCPEGVETAQSLEAALRLADGDVFVIGGASVYAQALPFCDEMLLTEVDSEYPEADVYFPDFDCSEWSSELIAENSDGATRYRHVRYTRKNNAAPDSNLQ